MASHLVKELQEFYIRVDADSGELKLEGFMINEPCTTKFAREYKSSRISKFIVATLILTWTHFATN